MRSIAFSSFSSRISWFFFITTLCALPKGAGTKKIRAEMRKVIEDKGFSGYESTYTDGSLKEEKVGCAVVFPTATLKYWLLPQTTIFNAAMFVILKATEHSKHHRKTVIIINSISSLTALERVYPDGNPTIPKILNLLAEEGEDLKLMWVPAHNGIEGNASADKAAKKALHEEPASEIWATENDWFKWTKEAAKKKDRNKWLASGERMVEIKPNLRQYKDTQNLHRQDQVVVSRIRMGYTRLTEAYRVHNSPQPQFIIQGDCCLRTITSTFRTSMPSEAQPSMVLMTNGLMWFGFVAYLSYVSASSIVLVSSGVST
jgi:hypothetical protein